MRCLCLVVRWCCTYLFFFSRGLVAWTVLTSDSFHQTCPTVANGYNVCDSNTGACSAGCNAGFTLYESGNTRACFATQSDVNNCGNPGTVCPSSYNGIGSSTCRSGNCKIVCPSGYFLRKANSDTNP